MEANRPEDMYDGDDGLNRKFGSILDRTDNQVVREYCTSEDVRVLTILFGDQVGSANRQSKSTNMDSSRLRERMRNIYQEVLARFPGLDLEEKKPTEPHVEYAGDAFVAVFAKPSEAVRCALYLQQAFRASPESIHVRIGLHDGEIVFREHATFREICGREASLCSRMTEMARGGQILLSRSVFDKARVNIAPDDIPGLNRVEWRNWGAYYFDGIEWNEELEAYDLCEVGEAEHIASERPARKVSVGKPVDGQAEEEGWRPAKGLTVPGRSWVLQDRLGAMPSEGRHLVGFEGQFGEVWRVWSPAEKEYRAFKFCFSKEGARTLKTEARLLNSLKEHRHSNLVTVYGVTDTTVPEETLGSIPLRYLEMEYVEGPSLADWLADKENPPSLQDRLEVVAQIADALNTVHAAGIYHRDIKPSNILLTHDKNGALQAKLTDFGLGATDNAELLNSLKASKVEGLAGTWDYIAPELKRTGPDRAKANARSDLFSLGLTLYQIVAMDLSAQMGPSWEQRLPDEILREDVAKCTTENPTDRLASAAELAVALRRHDRRLEQRRLEREREQERQRVEREREQERVRARHKAQRMRIIVVAATLIAAVSAVFGRVALTRAVAEKAAREEASRLEGIANDRAREASQERDRANREATEAEAARKETVRQLGELDGYQANVWLAERGDPIRALFYNVMAAQECNSVGHDPRVYLLSAQRLVWYMPCISVGFPCEDGTSPSFSPDGRWAVVSLDDNAVRVWDIAAGKPHGEPMRHGKRVYSAVFSPDGTRVVTASADNTARVWSVDTGKPVGEPMRHDDEVNSAAFSPDGKQVVTASDDSSVRLWDIATGSLAGTPIRHGAAVSTATFSPDGNWLVTVSLDSTARVWSKATGEFVGKPMRHDSGQPVPFSRDGKWVLTTSERDNVVQVWDVRTGDPVGKPMAHNSGGLSPASFSPDAKWVLTESDGKSIFVRETLTGKPIEKPITHDNIVYSASFSSDGERVLVASRDKVYIWNTSTGSPAAEPMGTGASVGYLLPSPDGKRVLTVSMDRMVRVWDLVEAGILPAIRMQHEYPVLSVSCGPDGRQVVTGSGDGSLRVWEGITCRSVGKHDQAVWSTRFAPDGKRVVTASADNTARVWSVDTGKPVGEPMRHDDDVNSAAFSPDGKWVVTASDDNTARVWESATGRPVCEPMRHDDNVNSAAFSPDGTRVVTVTSSGMLRIWSMNMGTPGGMPVEYHISICSWSASFSPDGKRIVATSIDGTASILDADTGEPIGEAMRHDGIVVSAVFSPDGKWIVTASLDRTARIWDAATGRPVGGPMRQGGPVRSASFSPDGKWIVTGSEDGTACVWPVGTEMDSIPEWFLRLPEALTGQRLAATTTLTAIPTDEYLKLREDWFAAVRSAAKAGDEAAQYVIWRWNPELAGVWAKGFGADHSTAVR